MRLCLLLALMFSTVVRGPLWPDKAPGSEAWTFTEKIEKEADGSQRVSDVMTPTLTVYLPKKVKPTGTGVIILPGGGMRRLSIHPYEASAAKWFNDRGIAAFVLKYRVLPTAWHTDGPMPVMTEFKRANANPVPDDARMTAVIEMAIKDAQQALRIARRYSTKLGMLGYSAGGGVAMGAVVADAPDARADFVISAYGPALTDVIVPKNPPPIFLAVRQYHPNVARALIALHLEWSNANASSELHVYEQSGPTPFLEPAGDWLQRAYEWMGKRGF
jgi:dienelactone hydrolase